MWSESAGGLMWVCSGISFSFPCALHTHTARLYLTTVPLSPIHTQVVIIQRELACNMAFSLQVCTMGGGGPEARARWQLGWLGGSH